MENLLLPKKLLLFLVFSYSTFCFAQVKQEWVALYDGPGKQSDNARSVAVDKEGNVYVTGSSTDTGAGFTRLDIATVKYNAKGVMKWVARYNGPGNNNDVGLSIAVDREGNAYVTGSSYGNGTYIDFVTIKYNSKGTEQWVARYNGPGNDWDQGHAIKVDDEGNVYVAGISIGAGTSFDYTTIKYNRNGIERWVARYNGPGNDDWANALTLDEEGNAYVTGRSLNGFVSDPGRDYATVKYSKRGKELWVARYDGPIGGFDEAHAIAVDKLGNVYVTGRSTGSFDEDGEDIATVKYNRKGIEQWAMRYNGPANSTDIGFDLAVDDRHNLYVTGPSTGGEADAVNLDFVTIRYDTKKGREVWIRRYNGPVNSSDQAKCLALDDKGNVYVTGPSYGTVEGLQRSDFATVKYNAAGVEQWAIRYNGAGNGDDIPNAMAVDRSGNVYVAGLTAGIDLWFDYATIKYSQPSPDCEDDHQHGWNKKPGYRLNLFNAPNPVHSITKIYYQLPSAGHVSLQVFDMMGRPVAMLVNSSMKAGNYSVHFNASGLHKGVYNYRLTFKTNNNVWVETKKLIVIK